MQIRISENQYDIIKSLRDGERIYRKLTSPRVYRYFWYGGMDCEIPEQTIQSLQRKEIINKHFELTELGKSIDFDKLTNKRED